MSKENKAILEEVANEIGEGIHVGLRKWSEHPQSSTAWKAISKIDDGSWEYIAREVAKEIIKTIRRISRKRKRV